MKIAMMTNNYLPFIGGVPISIQRLSDGLRREGHTVPVFAPTYREQTADRDVVRYRTLITGIARGAAVPDSFDRDIEREFAKGEFDVIHVHHPMMIGWTAVYLSRKYNVPLVFTYHTRYEQYASCYTKGICKLDRIMPLYLHGFLKRCDFVFAPTAGMQDYLTDICHVPVENTGILPTGIEQANFNVSQETAAEIRRLYGAEHMPLLLTVSRMASEKNVSFLLESLARVKALYRKPFRMLMIGDGPDKKALEERSRMLGLQEDIVFTGTIPNERIAAYFKAADGFLFASKTETQGIVVLEAFAGAAPVIAVKASGVEDLVDDGVNGILTGEDTEEYARAVTGFLNGTQMLPCSKMAENALQKAALYREEAVALKAVHYYNSVIAENETHKKRNIRLLPAG